MEVLFSVVINEKEQTLLLDSIKKRPDRLIFAVNPEKTDIVGNPLCKLETRLWRMLGTPDEIRNQLNYVVDTIYDSLKNQETSK